MSEDTHDKGLGRGLRAGALLTLGGHGLGLVVLMLLTGGWYDNVLLSVMWLPLIQAAWVVPLMIAGAFLSGSYRNGFLSGVVVIAGVTVLSSPFLCFGAIAYSEMH